VDHCLTNFTCLNAPGISKFLITESRSLLSVSDKVGSFLLNSNAFNGRMPQGVPGPTWIFVRGMPQYLGSQKMPRHCGMPHALSSQTIYLQGVIPQSIGVLISSTTTISAR
jgi:hypothetical protein